VASPPRELLIDLIRDGRVALLGVVRQEILSGIRDPKQFEKLRQSLATFPDVPLVVEDYEEAAEFYNTCISNGVQGSPVDLLICAAAHRRTYLILTTDPDFDRYERHLPVRLLHAS
jgi:predicted nucleic acid-binding protein